MLGGEVSAGRLADVIVDVGAGDRARLAVLADILEQHLAGEFLALGDDAFEIGVGDRRFVDDAVLAGIFHEQLGALAADMAAAQRRQAEALVGAGILFVADAHMLGVEQAHDRGEHGVALDLALPEVGLDALAELGQSLAELAAAVIFGGVLPGAIIGVVAILLAPAGVLAGRLDMPVGGLAEPGVDISGGERERIQAVDLGAVGDAFVAVEIAPRDADLLARVTGLAIRTVTKHPCDSCGV